ncbi:MAG: hypothetical protein HY820_01765 [Acidobacteria bacterium]|nr:hypothetical protein [Acidobacteriota bacterium]
MAKPAVTNKPMFWVEKQAWDFPTIWEAIGRNNKSKVPNEMIAVIFFEETSFVNTQQAGKNGPAVGFGQIEVGNRDKVPFYRWLCEKKGETAWTVSDLLMSELTKVNLSGPALVEKRNLQEKVRTKILGSNEYSVQIMCYYYEWLGTAASKDLSGIISAQIGSHLEYRTRFQLGYDALKAARTATGAERAKLRTQYIDALNLAKRRQSSEPKTNKQNPIPEKDYTVFWDWVLPEEFLRKQSVN